ncbi:MAG: carbamoyltransferase HypF [Acidobacteria bacterium]|nr:carbamoyltransferase HypF [Acidobacteriota bacterium]
MKSPKAIPDIRLADIPEKGRLRLRFTGVVQGVGFRPFLYRAAKKFALTGTVKNQGSEVLLEIQGKHLQEFMRHVERSAPPLSRIETLKWDKIKDKRETGFVILESKGKGDKDVMVSPDIALCAACAKEMADPSDRRYQYPFTNCTDCGPRFTIIEGLPYDRPKTTMKKFPMCPECRKEYGDSGNRRYHAQPVSCPNCGPRLQFKIKGRIEKKEPLAAAVKLLKKGKVVAIKGIGGYHLACQAGNGTALERLRRFKGRENKPFALMATMAMIQRHCRVSAAEKRLLQSPQAPIVLLEAKKNDRLLRLAAPGQNRLGFMLPYPPLHLVLIGKMNEPMVMTSANVSDEPILFDDTARELPGLCDAILSHDRPILSFADDSVTMVFEKEPYFIRRSRGFVPLPIALPFSSPKTVLALGGMLKTTFCLLDRERAFIGPHIGDTESNTALAAEKRAVLHFMKLFSLRPEVVAIDKHPAYPNRLLAGAFPEAEVVEVQHHQAHIASVLAENGEPGPVLGIALDGTGYGDDGTIWGGEFFVGGLRGLKRVGHLLPVFLPGGDAAAREPWRTALSFLVAAGETGRATRFAARFGRKGAQVLETVRERRGGVMTTSCGRLFDGVASLLGVGERNSYEGELPALLQAEAERARPLKKAYPYALERENGLLVLDLRLAIEAMLADRRGRGERAYRFHWTLANALLDMLLILGQEAKITTAALSGGVFQNILLLKMTNDLLQKNGFTVLRQRLLPANDGGISLGQAALAAMKYRKER